MPGKSVVWPITLAAVLALPAAAFAHTGVGETGGLVHGFLHPVGGLDHVLAMVMVGVLAAQIGGRALWLVPATFVTVMALGGAMGIAGMPLPFVEIGIAASVVCLGGMVALRRETSLLASAGIVGLFAVFHGYAHGAEMPVDASGLDYAAGFLAGTALLHAAGVGLGLAIDRLSRVSGPMVLRAAGGLAAFAGLGLLAGAL